MNRRLLYGGLNPPNESATQSIVNEEFNWNSAIHRNRSGNEKSEKRLQEMKQIMLRKTLPPPPPPRPTPLPIQEKATSKSPSLITYKNKINPNAPLLFSVPRNTRKPIQMPYSLRSNEWDGVMYNTYKQHLNKRTNIPRPSSGLYRQVEIPWKNDEKVIVVTFFEKKDNIPVFILQPSWRERTYALYVVDDVENFLNLSYTEQIDKLHRAALQWDWKPSQANLNAEAAANRAFSIKGGSKKGRKHTHRKHTHRKHTRRNRSFRK